MFFCVFGVHDTADIPYPLRVLSLEQDLTVLFDHILAVSTGAPEPRGQLPPALAARGQRGAEKYPFAT